jgi:hypothetical protein
MRPAERPRTSLRSHLGSARGAASLAWPPLRYPQAILEVSLGSSSIDACVTPGELPSNIGTQLPVIYFSNECFGTAGSLTG